MIKGLHQTHGTYRGSERGYVWWDNSILIQVVSRAVAATLHLHLNPHRVQVQGMEQTSSNLRTNHVCKYITDIAHGHNNYTPYQYYMQTHNMRLLAGLTTIDYY